MKVIKKSSAGKRGESVRSDCYFEIELTTDSGKHLTQKNKSCIEIELKSKVSSMYGESIKKEILDICRFFGIHSAKIFLEDNGALPFVIEARLESAIKRLLPELDKEYWIPFNKNNSYKTSKEKIRRSRLYLPGNEPKFFINSGLHKPDGIILDLEDSVAPSEKDTAQLLVRNALRAVDFYGVERMVRINQLPQGLKDLKFIIPHNVHVVLIPKCESVKHVLDVEDEINRIKENHKIKNEIYLMPIIESALGVTKAYDIASASKNICALTIGLEDYTSDIGTQRTFEGKESFLARSTIVNAAKASGIQAIDTVFSDVADMEGLKESVLEAKSLGFEGKGCIHPRQIKVIHDAFSPTVEELEKAGKIVRAFKEAKKMGLGVVSLGTKMIDLPVVKRAQKIIELSKNLN